MHLHSRSSHHRSSACSLISALLLLVTSLLPFQVQAEQMVRYGDYQIHYIAFPSTFLQPEVAKALNIRRSKGIGIINVSVRKERPDGTTEPVAALVKGTATNQVEQQRVLDFQQVQERGGAYSLAQFLFSAGDPLRIDLEIWAEPGGRPYPVTFTTSLYPE